MGWFKRKQARQEAAPPNAEGAYFLIPNDVTWTVEDINELEAGGNHREALARWRRLLEPFEDPQYADQIAGMPSHRIILQHIGWCCRLISRLDEARTAFEKAAPLARKAGDTAALADVLRGLGMVHRSLGDSGRALHYLEEADAAASETGQDRLRASIHEDMALCHGLEGRMDRAMAETRVAYSLLTGKSGSEPGIETEIEAHLLGNLGVASLERGREKEAADLLERALVKARETGNAEMEAQIRSNLAVVIR